MTSPSPDFLAADAEIKMIKRRQKANYDADHPRVFTADDDWVIRSNGSVYRNRRRPSTSGAACQRELVTSGGDS